jgi:NMD protein affecting ribosome stability and mRNA decay
MKENRVSYLVRRDADRKQGIADDPYRAAAKPPEPTVCPTCHASFKEGRWTWAKAPADAHHQLCPACQRINDEFPGGYVTLKGPFLAEHRDEIVALINSHERKEKAERPLQRIMAIDTKRDGLEVTTTDSHLARGIAEAVHGAYKGELKLRYSRDENLLRASWKR